MLRFFIFIVGLFFLSIPIPGFVPSDRFAWTGPLRLSFTDRRNSSLRSSDTTGRTFGKPNRTLVPAPMVFRHKTLHLTAELNRQRKYKRKSTTIGSRNIRLISREIDISQIKTNLQFSDNVSRRWSGLVTIGALASVVLLFLNARPMVSDELARSSAGQWRKALTDRSRRTGLTG